ncbi:TMV resistance protein N-like [Neltuma alba]|uniref:TMV resistance protein N-like n=1 Tax=Neltuma alba TaxID=207710 RepID=UPI0010A3A399|nr:TMV resistance protein N-like [Prosopis alba]
MYMFDYDVHWDGRFLLFLLFFREEQSFRGSDIRHTFLSHLKKQLQQKGIDVYVDERLERGDKISSALLEAIERSIIALVIFSKDYASSRWCLQELEKIMECKRVNNQIIIPVFYNVDPSHVRHQEGSYANAFAQHEQKFKDDLLQIWRSVLKETANLSGYHHSSDFHSCFVSNVREESKRIGSTHLLEQILSVLLNDENITMKGRSNTQRRLSRTRVLLVLDDVDTSSQLKFLIEDNLSLGPGSKVIITSRDKHVLHSGGIHQEIFLDIVFFFKGEKEEDIMRVMDACDDFYVDCGIDSFLDKALVTISRDNRVEIHDLLQEMAEQIVYEKFRKHPERRNRLNDAKEIQDILENNKGTDAIEGITLEIENDLYLSAGTF